MELTKNYGIQLEHAQVLYQLFKEYSIILLESKKNKSNKNDNKNVLKKLFYKQNQQWEKMIKQKANEFSNYYKV